MATTQDEQIKKLRQAHADLEAHRPILGDEAVDVALVPSKRKLAELEAMAADSKGEQATIPIRQHKSVSLRYLDVVDSTSMTHFRPFKIMRPHIGPFLKLAKLNLSERN